MDAVTGSPTVTRFYLVGLLTRCEQELEATPALYEGQRVTNRNFN